MSDVARAYPKDLAGWVRAEWPKDAHPLPRHFESLLDVAYHASFLRDEERAVTCRVLVMPRDELPIDSGPPATLLPLVFESPRDWDEDELRRLAPAAEVQRSLIGVEEEGESLVIWGIVQSGPRWLQVAQGGRNAEPLLPPALVIKVVRPGQLIVACGSRLIAELRGGHLSASTLDVFRSRWLPARFEEERALMASEHAASARLALDARDAAAFTGYLAQQMLKRIVTTMRSRHHGGTLIVGPITCLSERNLFAKYSFVDAPPRRRFRGIALSILATIAEHAAQSGRSAVEEYRSSQDPLVGELDEALFEIGHLIASLTAVDGAVVLTKRFEVLGFGAEIAGSLPNVGEVRRALDLEADRFVVENVDAVGTRHRSAYRLCAAAPDTLAIVVSQDGGMRFVANHGGAVTFWDHGLGAD